MKKFIIGAIAFLCLASGLAAQPKQRSFITYYDLKDFLFTSPGAYKFGMYGYENPAMTSYLTNSDMMFMLSGKGNEMKNFNRWGLFYGSPYFGSGVMTFKDGRKSITDYRFSLAFGDRDLAFGLGYGFTGGDKAYFGRSNVITAGMLARPNSYVSIGAQGTFALNQSEYEGVAELAIRPIKNYPLTFFGDFAMFNDQNMSKGKWSSGASWEFLPGVRASGRYFDDKSYSFGMEVSMGHYGIGAISNNDKDGNNFTNTVMLRVGAKDRTIIEDMPFMRGQYMKLDLSGPIAYQSYVWFDKSKTLLDILSFIDRAKRNPNIRGIVVNATGMQAGREMVWEIRDRLRDFKEAGKKVVIFFDRGDINLYHFASVADKIIMDTQGTMMLNGYAMGRSYYKRLLDRCNIGFEEIRLFKYKSAVENFARDEMSEGDREQRQKLVDDWYEITKNEVCTSRHISNDKYETLANGKIMIMPDEAVKEKLVDTLGRWVNAEEIVKKLDVGCMNFVDPFLVLEDPDPVDDKWSEAIPKVAVVYAIGACSMEGGINARSLVVDIKRAMSDNSIKAVVLRVDSPGGDAMASDYIAQVIRDYKGKKPIIVSQGGVAGSGGYWLSMDGDKIVAAPMTITGSIGVISSWIYDKGLQDSLGISTYIVKKGKYADLGYPFSLPIIGIGLPVRNLNAEERSQFEGSISSMYKEFVSKVAAGRKQNKEKIDSLAQGRVWTGMEGKRNGLVDELGGLWDAIVLAAKSAGIEKTDNLQFVEYPARKLFDFGSLLPSPFGSAVKTDEIARELEVLKSRLDSRGMPMPVVDLEYYDYLQK